ncbi:hypothetical protein N7510_007060 [Penicillium lagena]|uniref:uncharacterized protein n=1 Tax=Penicillium lagena TaxID=94218 RepID=UPI00254003F7|nr:uncharacterized protein N7510_007060 [Penicillium lagena]KAJ5610341.1 hypothetical protein N7510_007060 [Penicillium lagena]
MEGTTGPTLTDRAAPTYSAMVTLAATIVYTFSVHASVVASESVEALAEHLPVALKLDLIASALAIIALMIPKISIALLLVRILNPSRPMKIFILSTSILALVMGVIAVIIEFVQCDPIPGQWDPDRYHPTCWSPNVQMDYSYFVGAWSAALDFLYAAYPASVILKLNLPTSRKIEITILMGLGIISGSVAIYKTSLFRLFMLRKNIPQEALYVMSQLSMWTIIETNITIIAACIPLTSPVWRIVKRHAAVHLNKIGFDIRTTTTGSGSRRAGQGYREFSKGTDKKMSSRSANGIHGQDDSQFSEDRSRIYIQHDIQVDQTGTAHYSDTIPLSHVRDLP